MMHHKKKKILAHILLLFCPITYIIVHKTKPMVAPLVYETIVVEGPVLAAYAATLLASVWYTLNYHKNNSAVSNEINESLLKPPLNQINEIYTQTQHDKSSSKNIPELSLQIPEIPLTISEHIQKNISYELNAELNSLYTKCNNISNKTYSSYTPTSDWHIFSDQHSIRLQHDNGLYVALANNSPSTHQQIYEKLSQNWLDQSLEALKNVSCDTSFAQNILSQINCCIHVMLNTNSSDAITRIKARLQLGSLSLEHPYGTYLKYTIQNLQYIYFHSSGKLRSIKQTNDMQPIVKDFIKQLVGKKYHQTIARYQQLQPIKNIEKTSYLVSWFKKCKKSLLLPDNFNTVIQKHPTNQHIMECLRAGELGQLTIVEQLCKQFPKERLLQTIQSYYSSYWHHKLYDHEGFYHIVHGDPLYTALKLKIQPHNRTIFNQLLLYRHKFFKIIKKAWHITDNVSDIVHQALYQLMGIDGKTFSDIPSLIKACCSLALQHPEILKSFFLPNGVMKDFALYERAKNITLYPCLMTDSFAPLRYCINHALYLEHAYHKTEVTIWLDNVISLLQKNTLNEAQQYDVIATYYKIVQHDYQFDTNYFPGLSISDQPKSIDTPQDFKITDTNKLQPCCNIPEHAPIMCGTGNLDEIQPHINTQPCEVGESLKQDIYEYPEKNNEQEKHQILINSPDKLSFHQDALGIAIPDIKIIEKSPEIDVIEELTENEKELIASIIKEYQLLNEKKLIDQQNQIIKLNLILDKIYDNKIDHSLALLKEKKTHWDIIKLYNLIEDDQKNLISLESFTNSLPSDLSFSHIFNLDTKFKEKGEKLTVKLFGLHSDYKGILQKSGIYHFDIIKQLSNGTYLTNIKFLDTLKSSPSSMFPNSWDVIMCTEKIIESIENTSKVILEGNRVTFEGLTKDNLINIRTVVDSTGKIITSYPIL